MRPVMRYWSGTQTGLRKLRHALRQALPVEYRQPAENTSAASLNLRTAQLQKAPARGGLRWIPRWRFGLVSPRGSAGGLALVIPVEGPAQSLRDADARLPVQLGPGAG